MVRSKVPGVSTPQFRTLLLRRLKNRFPSCTARIESAPRGLTFQLFDAEGRARSRLVSMYQADARVLRRQWLAWSIRRLGAPEAGFPEELG